MTEPSEYDLSSMTGVEKALHSLVNELTKAELALARARNNEVDCRHNYEHARRRAVLSEECPQVFRGGVTTAYRDAWVDGQCVDQRRLFDLGEVARKAAEDHLRVVRDQAMIVMAISKAHAAAYNTSGVAG